MMKDTNIKYIALTIGPIYETFSQVKRTRAVWAASYFFSWFMKQLTLKAYNEGFKILLPALNDEEIIFDSSLGSGLYADRIYFEPSEKSIKDVNNIVGEVIDVIVENISLSMKGEIKNFLNQYLNIHIVEANISKKKEVLKTLNAILDQKELTKNYVFNYEKPYLLNYLEGKKITKSILATDAFSDSHSNRKFLSITEIAT